MSRAAIFGSSWTLLLVLIGLPGALAHLDDDPPPIVNKAFNLVQDNATNYNLEILPDYMGGDGWPTAIQILQEVFEGAEDAFVPVTSKGPDGKEVVVLTGARGEALRILASLPAQGRAVYASMANPRGKELLATARKNGDWQMVANVVRRYPLTPAGWEAAKLLGTHYLDRGDPPQAARWFRLWQERNPHWPDDGLGLCLAWAAVTRSGQAAQANELWQTLQFKHAAGLVLDGHKVSLAELKNLWQTAKPAVAGPALPWSTYAGNAARIGSATTLPAVDAKLWSVPTTKKATDGLLEEAIRLQEDRPQPVMPGAFPIVAGDNVVCRTSSGIQAVDLATGKVLWESPFDRSLDRLLADAESRFVIDYWVGSYLRYHPQVLLENTNLGCLSADSARIYAVDTMPVVPFVSRVTGKKPSYVVPPYDAAVAEAIQRSRLCALDANTGGVAWEVGGRPDGESFLDRCFFLGPPLPLHGKLYGMAEKGSYLYLYCLEPATGKLRWKQCLGSTQYTLAQDGGRRLQALHLSHDQGILICPTNGGAVVAYDLHTSSLLWAHAYRTKTVRPVPKIKGLRPTKELEIESIPNLRNQLQVTAPVIFDGKVVIAAPDSPAVECLRLADGAALWKVERTSDDLFLAGVHGDKVLVIGRSVCRALSLADGKELWHTEVGVPSGQGVMVGDSYLLPVKVNGQAKSAGVVQVDLATGQVKQLPEVPGQQVAGNLLVVNDRLIVQSITTLAGWGAK
jgi:outer membrane protein assembly factor BamB